jgi:UDP-N-acetylmuramoyl-L-alanyl-D-glutamate--2,6-diaminopimelate ligase
MSHTLASLLDDPSLPAITIEHLVEDSRDVQPGDAFLAFAGSADDGHLHVDAAVAAGAVCVLSERSVASRVPNAVVADLRARRGRLAARFYDDPSRAVACAGVTGTNGKTSVAFHIADFAARTGQSCGYLGTIGWGVVPRLEPARLTTESPCTTQRRLADLRARGCVRAAIEASSHALAQGRLDGVSIRAAVFTNLTRDHLDYHDDFEAYGAAKERLFGMPGVDLAVINTDDPFGAGLARRTSVRGLRVLTTGQRGDLRWRALGSTATGQQGMVSTPWGEREMRVPLPGGFAVANVLAAIAVLAGDGTDLDALVEAAAALTPVPGRLELINRPNETDQPLVFVDYAHTPDAVDKVLSALRERCTGRLVCVVGCGGERDRGKRPQMARAAERVADAVWLTSDNPRSEDPAAILTDMRAGLEGGACVHENVDRAQAVREAFASTRPGDVLEIAGKGHEIYQEVAGVRYPHSDRELARELLAGTVRPPLPPAPPSSGVLH